MEGGENGKSVVDKEKGKDKLHKSLEMGNMNACSSRRCWTTLKCESLDQGLNVCVYVPMYAGECEN